MQEEKFIFVNFSERFVSLMQAAGITQKELAKRIGAAESSLINWKRGKIPKSEELYKLAQSFGCSMEWLLTGEEALPEGCVVMSNAEHPSAASEQRIQELEQKLAEIRRILDD